MEQFNPQTVSDPGVDPVHDDNTNKIGLSVTHRLSMVSK